jgi:hypothetical protein
VESRHAAVFEVSTGGMKSGELSSESGRHRLFICAPVLGLARLAVLRWTRRGRSVTVYYDKFPRYLRGIVRYLRVRDKSIERWFEILSGSVVKKILHGDDVADYPYLFLRSMEVSAKVADEVVSGLSRDYWLGLTERLVGPTPATAFVTKHLAHAVVWPQALALIACAGTLEHKEEFTVVWNADWPDAWLEVVSKHLGNIKFDFFEWPGWCRRGQRLFLKYSLLTQVLGLILGLILRRGVVARPKSGKAFKVLAEFIEPTRFQGTAHDADYWIDGDKIKPDDVLFFLTEDQEKLLVQDGYNIESIIKDAQQNGYQIQPLRRLPYSKDFLSGLRPVLGALLRGLYRAPWSPMASEFLKTWHEYLKYAPLFINCPAKNFVYPRFPNGNATWRFNNAVLTGLCRAYGVTSVGCQTRVQYANEFEFLFDCYDIFLAWGPAWVDFLGSGTRFVDRTISVGCIYLDNSHANGNKLLPGKQKSSSISVTVFTGDMGGSHFTRGYSLSFLKSCVKLALQHSNCTFRVKTKEPEHVASILADEEFRSMYEQVQGNFVFLELARHDYFEVLNSSDIVLAIGFTSPGAEAALLGKRVIYYTELKTGGEVFRQLPDFIARNDEELSRLFQTAVDDYQEYAQVNSKKLDSLDPFRDGLARKRIAEVLVG